MTETEPMFDPAPYYVDLSRGDAVVAQTIWGDEPGTVLETGNGLAKVALKRGDIIYISLPRVVITDV